MPPWRTCILPHGWLLLLVMVQIITWHIITMLTIVTNSSYKSIWLILVTVVPTVCNNLYMLKVQVISLVLQYILYSLNYLYILWFLLAHTWKFLTVFSVFSVLGYSAQYIYTYIVPHTFLVSF